jgi:hypothetical protein
VDIRKCESQWVNNQERITDNILRKTEIKYAARGRRKIGRTESKF